MTTNLLNRPAFIYGISMVIFIASLAPLWCFQYFPTVDGPAHLYNARIIRELWWGNAEIYTPFFYFNPEPVPNWTGHLIAAVAGTFLPVWLVEKLLLSLIVTGLPVSILAFVRSMGGKISWNMLLLLPFTYTITLYLGFFNFLLAVSLLFVVLVRMINSKEQLTMTSFIISAVLVTLLYFSHALVFGIALAFTCMFFLWKKMIGKNVSIFSRSNVLKIFCFIPALLLALVFFTSRGTGGFRNKMEMHPINELLKWLKEGAPLVGLNGPVEVPHTSIYMLGLLALLVITALVRFRQSASLTNSDLLLFFSLCLLVLYFTSPDGMASGGFISLRLLLLSMLFATVWLLTVKTPIWLHVFAALLGVYVCFSTFSYRFATASQLNAEAKNMVEISRQITSGSVVLPLNYSTNWLHINLSGYAGAAAPVIVLDNYEAIMDVFPLRWKTQSAPGDLAGDFAKSLNPTITIEKYEAVTGNRIDFVTRWEFHDNPGDSIAVFSDKRLRALFDDVMRIGKGDLFFDRIGR